MGCYPRVRMHVRGSDHQPHQAYRLRFTMEPSGAAEISFFIPSKSRPTVSLSKYLTNQHPSSRARRRDVTHL